MNTTSIRLTVIAWSCLSMYLPAYACELNADKVAKTMGVKTTATPDGVIRVAWPRKDVEVVVDGLKMKPFMGLGTWAAFMKTKHGGMVMGDTVLFEDEVNPAIDAAFAHGLEVTGLHNHFLFDRPKVYFMHIGGEGCPDELAKGVRAVWDAVKHVREHHAQPQSAFAGSAPSYGKLDVDQLAQIVGEKPTAEDGMVKFTIGRPANMHGQKVAGSMGLTTWAALAGSSDYAVMDGDFAMQADEVQAVLKSLRKSGVNIVALHNHMIGETPAYYFVHFWGEGSPSDLARSFRSALDAQKSGSIKQASREVGGQRSRRHFVTLSRQ